MQAACSFRCPCHKNVLAAGAWLLLLLWPEAHPSCHKNVLAAGACLLLPLWPEAHGSVTR
eukprot:scaffold86963_cov17-Tisochrysis_lutea.AAC.4